MNRNHFRQKTLLTRTACRENRADNSSSSMPNRAERPASAIIASARNGMQADRMTGAESSCSRSCVFAVCQGCRVNSMAAAKMKTDRIQFHFRI